MTVDHLERVNGRREGELLEDVRAKRIGYLEPLFLFSPAVLEDVGVEQTHER